MSSWRYCRDDYLIGRYGYVTDLAAVLDGAVNHDKLKRESTSKDWRHEVKPAMQIEREEDGLVFAGKGYSTSLLNLVCSDMASDSR
ncbi:hypothetical protein [Methylobacter sp.]